MIKAFYPIPYYLCLSYDVIVPHDKPYGLLPGLFAFLFKKHKPNKLFIYIISACL